MSDCSAGQTARVSSNLHPTSTMAVSRVPSPPPQEVNTPVAENWCYTQVRKRFLRPLGYICRRGWVYNERIENNEPRDWKREQTRSDGLLRGQRLNAVNKRAITNSFALYCPYFSILDKRMALIKTVFIFRRIFNIISLGHNHDLRTQRFLSFSV